MGAVTRGDDASVPAGDIADCEDDSFRLRLLACVAHVSGIARKSDFSRHAGCMVARGWGRSEHRWAGVMKTASVASSRGSLGGDDDGVRASARPRTDDMGMHGLRRRRHG